MTNNLDDATLELPSGLAGVKDKDRGIHMKVPRWEDGSVAEIVDFLILFTKSCSISYDKKNKQSDTSIFNRTNRNQEIHVCLLQ